jgi:hypothetical protein
LISILQRQFKAKLVSLYPADDDPAFFATAVQRYGWGCMSQYRK